LNDLDRNYLECYQLLHQLRQQTNVPQELSQTAQTQLVLGQAHSSEGPVFAFSPLGQSSQTNSTL